MPFINNCMLGQSSQSTPLAVVDDYYYDDNDDNDHSKKNNTPKPTKPISIVAVDIDDVEIDGALSMMDEDNNCNCLEEKEKDESTTLIKPNDSCTTLSTILSTVSDSENENVVTKTTQLTSILSTSKRKPTDHHQNKINKPRVKFANLEMRFYNRTLGNNPACSTGPPVELDWTYNNKTFSTSIQDYETHRLPRRTRRQLVMTTVTRRNMMVYHFGFTHDQIDRAANSTKKVQKQRERTKSLSPAMERRQEIAENFTKIFKRRSSSSSSSSRSRVGRGGSSSSLLTSEQKRVVEAYENDHFNTLLMVR